MRQHTFTGDCISVQNIREANHSVSRHFFLDVFLAECWTYGSTASRAYWQLRFVSVPFQLTFSQCWCAKVAPERGHDISLAWTFFAVWCRSYANLQERKKGALETLSRSTSLVRGLPVFSWRHNILYQRWRQRWSTLKRWLQKATKNSDCTMKSCNRNLSHKSMPSRHTHTQLQTLF